MVDRVIRILVIIFAIVAVPLAVYGIAAGPVPGTGIGTSSIDANVNFDGVNFTIQNADNFDWTDVLIEVNFNYDLQVNRMQAGMTYTYAATQFVASGGIHLDPYTETPTDMTITCTLPDGSTGTWYGSSA